MRIEILMRLYSGVSLFINIVSGIIVVYALSTWFLRPDNALFRLLARFCEPLLAPFRGISRKLIERGLMIDISVILALLSLRAIGYLLYRLMLLLL